MNRPELSGTELFDCLAPVDPSAETPVDFRGIPHMGGVYLLSDSQDRTIQLSSTGSLRRTLQIKLGRLPGDQRGRVDYLAVCRTVRWRAARSHFEQFYRYSHIARRLGVVNEPAYQPAWFLAVDPSNQFPEFVHNQGLTVTKGVSIGPFRDKKAAHRFADQLVDLFDLCRYQHILRQAPNGAACAYKDIGKCPAPCDGTVTMGSYRKMASHAVSAAIGETDEIRSYWENRMTKASQALEFERAGAIRKKLDTVRRLRKGGGEFADLAERFDFLIIQRHRGRKGLTPFFVRRGIVEAGEPFNIDTASECLPAWAEAMTTPPTPEPPEVVDDHVSLVTHFLFRRSDPGLYVKYRRDVGLPDDLGERIRDHFTSDRRVGSTKSNEMMDSDA